MVAVVVGIAGRVRSCLRAISAFATIDVTNQDTAIAIHRNVKKKSSSDSDRYSRHLRAVIPCAASGIWRRNRRRPVPTAVKRMRDIQMPNSAEVGRAAIAGAGGGSVKRNSSRGSAPCHRRWKVRVLQTR